MSIWDDPDLRTGGEFVKLENVGDEIRGEILAIRAHTFDDGKKVPQIILRTYDGEERTWTAGQVQARVKLAEMRPEVGDHIRVVLSNVERRSGGKTLKHIDIQIRRAGEVAGAAPAPVVQAAPPAVAGEVATAANTSWQAARANGWQAAPAATAAVDDQIPF